MDTSARDGPLAGLVSPEAEVLYARLLDDGRLAIGPDGVDLESDPVRELLAARVAYRSPIRANELKPTTQATALQLLLSQQHRDIAGRQERAAAGWRLLDSVLSAAVGPSGATGQQSDELAEVISGRETLNRLAYELQQSVQHELLGLSTGVYTSPIAEELLVAPPSFATSAGKRFRVIYDTEFASNKSGAHVIEASVAAGESARIRAHLPLKMLHVDDRVALVALTATGMDGSLLVRSPHLLAALRGWFELLWSDPGTTRVDDGTAGELSAVQRQILRAMASGMSDETIARSVDTSVRTVRRHISSVMENLGVNSRFAAGAMAAKRGWI